MSSHARTVAQGELPAKNVGGRPPKPQTVAENVVVDAHAIAMDLVAEANEIDQRAALRHLAVERERARELEAARCRARERAQHLFGSAA